MNVLKQNHEQKSINFSFLKKRIVVTTLIRLATLYTKILKTYNKETKDYLRFETNDTESKTLKHTESERPNIPTIFLLLKLYIPEQNILNNFYVPFCSVSWTKEEISYEKKCVFISPLIFDTWINFECKWSESMNKKGHKQKQY